VWAMLANRYYVDVDFDTLIRCREDGGG
jgi:hypothetical protein